MSAFVVAISNMKGGVGKTATTISLSEALAASGSKVLVVDLDAQTNCSFCIAGNEILLDLIESGRTITARLDDAILRQDHRFIQPYIRENASDVTHNGDVLSIDLLASGTELRELEREVIYTLTDRKYSMKGIEGQVKLVLEKDLNVLRNQYDYILFDCAPGISAFTEVAIALSDLVVIPTIPDFISTLGVEAFSNTVLRNGDHVTTNGATGPKPYVLATKVRGTPYHQQTLIGLRLQASDPESNFNIFETAVGETVIIPNALEMVDEAPTYTQKWGNVIPTIESLMREIEEVRDGTQH